MIGLLLCFFLNGWRYELMLSCIFLSCWLDISAACHLPFVRTTAPQQHSRFYSCRNHLFFLLHTHRSHFSFLWYYDFIHIFWCIGKWSALQSHFLQNNQKCLLAKVLGWEAIKTSLLCGSDTVWCKLKAILSFSWVQNMHCGAKNE